MKKVKIVVVLLLGLLSIISVKSVTVSAYNVNNDFSGSFVYMRESDFNNDFKLYERKMSRNLTFGMETYFQNLSTFSPENSYGSCGYVSFIQYLSYLDTFVNDSFIPEIYERNQGNANSITDALSISPGVLRQSYPKENLYGFIQNNKSSDFQMYLMDIVNSSIGCSPSEYSCSIGMWDYYRILNALFPTYNVEFSYTTVNDFGSGAKPTDKNIVNWFDSYVKEQLDLGNPVVLHIAEYNESTGEREKYHSIVAYYYDESGIHANFGWGENSTDVVISSNYQITEAGVIDLSNIEVTHSNNYIINNVEYCGCGMQKHSHNYENHFCTICEEYTSSHDYHEPYTWVDYTQHKATCGCGATIKQGHAVASGSYYLGQRYAKCLLCGGLAEMGFVQWSIRSTVKTKVTIHGSFILPNGVIVLENDDLEAYLNGTLIFYENGNIPVSK